MNFDPLLTVCIFYSAAAVSICSQLRLPLLLRNRLLNAGTDNNISSKEKKEEKRDGSLERAADEMRFMTGSILFVQPESRYMQLPGGERRDTPRQAREWSKICWKTAHK